MNTQHAARRESQTTKALNAYRTPSRLPALAMAALMTVSILMGIDSLARDDEPAMKVAARVAAAQRPA